MSGAKQAAKKAVSTVKRAWTNKVLAKIGRRSATPAEPADDAFRANGIYAEPERIGLPKTEGAKQFAGNSKAAQFGRVMEVLHGSPLDKIQAAAKDFLAPLVDDDAAMITMTADVTAKQLDQELRDQKGNLKSGDELDQAKNAMFRGNSDWSRLGVAFVKAHPEGEAFIERCSETMRSKLKAFSGSGELRPSAIKMERDPKNTAVTDEVTSDIEEEFQERAKNVSGMMLGVLDTIMAGDIPKPLALMVGSTVLSARGAGLDDEQIRKMVGAFVVLRIVNPALTEVLAKPDKSGWKPSADQGRMALNITKAMQNMANGVSGTAKEAFLKPLMDALQSRSKAMDAWFDQIADDGAALVRSALPEQGQSGGEGSSSQTIDAKASNPDRKGKGKVEG